MSETKQSLDLSALEKDYDIVGELSGRGDTRTFSATRKDAGTKRRDDQTGVLISVVTTPAGDEGNALSHLAADTTLLAGMSHRRLIPVVEGRWIGTDAFAVVTQRTTDSSLAEKLAIGETFTTPRIAAILREVNGLLEWAREHEVVHRSITADKIYLEPKTDRVRVSFGVAPIPRIQQADAATHDARTIVQLAMAMLTGNDDPETYETQCLTDMRAGLPERLCDATTALLDEKNSHTAADVASYIALIGMADPLFVGEEEADRIRADILEEQRVEREKLATERAEFERAMAEERANFEQTMAGERANFERITADERANFERLMAEERDKLAKERAALQLAVTSERAALVAKRAELERVVAEQRKEIERVAAEDRRRIDALRAELQRAGELEVEKKRQTELDEISDAESTLNQEEFATPLFVPPVIAPLKELIFDDDSVLMRDEEVVVAPMRDDAMPHDASGENATVTIGRGAQPARKQWIMAAALVGLVAIIGISAIALGRRDTPIQPATKTVAKAPVAALPAPAVPLPIVDSSGGSLAASLDSSRAVAPVVKRTPKKIVTDSAASLDSTVKRDSTALGDSLFQFRGAAPKRDTLVKRDSLVRRDTLVPVNGTFTTAQRAIYQLVRDAQA